MASDILAGKWKQMRGNAKIWWGKLTDDELDQVAGNKDVLVGKLQEKYGWTKQEASDEVDKRMAEYEKSDAA